MRLAGPAGGLASVGGVWGSYVGLGMTWGAGDAAAAAPLGALAGSGLGAGVGLRTEPTARYGGEADARGPMHDDDVSAAVLDAAIAVHRALGPGPLAPAAQRLGAAHPVDGVLGLAYELGDGSVGRTSAYTQISPSS